MYKKLLRPLALLLLCALLLPVLSGCAILDSYAHFFSGAGTKDPTPVLPADPPAEGLTSLTIGYDESYRLNGRFLSLSDVQTEDETLLSITEAEGSFTIRARGVGEGLLTYELNGEELSIPVCVTPAPLAVFFILGEEDARGESGTDPALLRAADGMAYYVFPEYGTASRATPQTVEDYIPYSLTENNISFSGGELYYKTNELTAAGEGRRAGLAAPLAYKWAEQTGEHVLVINMAKADCSIRDLLPGASVLPGAATESELLAAMAKAVFNLLLYEYGEGHYTHARTGWFLSQGERDNGMQAGEYLAALQTLSAEMERALTFTRGGVEHKPDFGGILGCRAGRRNDVTIAEMSGPRTAQLLAAGMGGELAKVYLLSDTASTWYSDISIEKWFSQYDARKFLLYYGYERPVSMDALYTAQGGLCAAAYNELAVVAVENLLHVSGLRTAQQEPTLSFLAYNGIDRVEEHLLLSYGEHTVAAVPTVSPLYAAKEAGYTVSLAAEGKTADLCRLSGVAKGDEVLLVCTNAAGQREERSLPVVRVAQFAFADSKPVLQTQPSGAIYFISFGGFYRYGYMHKTNGAFTPYVKLDWRTGWLYDGMNIWTGHGGVKIIGGYQVGPLDNWDSGYEFTAPEDGEVTVQFEKLLPPANDYLFAICHNGKPVWPKSAADCAADDVFYTVRKDSTLEEINAAVAALQLTMKKGDTLTFVTRRIGRGLTAEGALHPVVEMR